MSQGLVFLSALYGPLLVNLPAHHHIVGGFGKAIFAHGSSVFVQSVAKAVIQIISKMPLHLNAQMSVIEARVPVAVTRVVVYLKAAGIVYV